MTLENWVRNSWLEKRASHAAEIGRLLALADGRLEDYQRAIAGKLSADVQLALAYDAIRISATAALRAAGYRVVRGGSEHYRTIEALEFSIDPQKKLISTLDKLRKKRNIGSYDDFSSGFGASSVIVVDGKQASRTPKYPAPRPRDGPPRHQNTAVAL